MKKNENSGIVTYTVAETELLVRGALGQAFPDVPFEISHKVYPRMGGRGVVYVEYEDAEKFARVERVCEQFDGLALDGSDDSATPQIHEISGEKRYYLADVISVDRHFTDKFLDRVIACYLRATGHTSRPVIEHSQDRPNRAWVKVGTPLRLPIMKLAKSLREQDLDTLDQTIGQRLTALGLDDPEEA